jgi:hypothetical protein
MLIIRGQFGPKQGGQFALKQRGHFAPKWRGQFGRNIHFYFLTLSIQINDDNLLQILLSLTFF